MDGRLEAGWVQRIAWVALTWGSLGLLVWVPFFYVAVRRRLASDWGAFASFTLYEVVTVPWSWKLNGGHDPYLSTVVMVTLLAATLMLLFALFDKGQPRRVAYAPAAVPPPGRNPYLG